MAFSALLHLFLEGEIAIKNCCKAISLQPADLVHPGLLPVIRDAAQVNLHRHIKPLFWPIQQEIAIDLLEQRICPMGLELLVELQGDAEQDLGLVIGWSGDAVLDTIKIGQIDAQGLVLLAALGILHPHPNGVLDDSVVHFQQNHF